MAKGLESLITIRIPLNLLTWKGNVRLWIKNQSNIKYLLMYDFHILNAFIKFIKYLLLL